MSSDLQSFFAVSREAVNTALASVSRAIRESVAGPVGEAMAYSLEAPGKRLRPILVLAAYRELGGTGDATTLATAVETVHTYSLVHDDLPCMDDDELRRGRPTTHVQFGVAAATEAAFRMVPLAARLLSRGAAELGLNGQSTARLGKALFQAAGAAGMVGGQVLDLEAEGKSVSIDELKRIHAMKTGALITASVEMGALAAGAGPDQLEGIRGYGMEVGLAFQIVDDILDSTSTSTELGKTAGKDARQRKATFTTILSDYAARSEAEACVTKAVDYLDKAGIQGDLLQEIARFVIDRRS